MPRCPAEKKVMRIAGSVQLDRVMIDDLLCYSIHESRAEGHRWPNSCVQNTVTQVRVYP